MKPFADHFSRLAPAYASCRPRYPEELFGYLAGLLDRHELAWDCAAGSGQATIPLAQTFQRVLATDASAAMLDQAPRHPRVEYRVATAERSGLGAGTADLVVVAQALHWLDLDRFYREVVRVLAPGGVLAVWTYGTQFLDDPGITGCFSGFTLRSSVPTGRVNAGTWSPATTPCRFPFPSSSPGVLPWKKSGPSPSCWDISAPGRPPSGFGRVRGVIRSMPWARKSSRCGVHPPR